MQQENVLLASIIFSVISSTITQLGIILGQTISKQNQEKMEIIGIIILVIITIYYYFKR